MLLVNALRYKAKLIKNAWTQTIAPVLDAEVVLDVVTPHLKTYEIQLRGPNGVPSTAIIIVNVAQMGCASLAIAILCLQ